MSSKKRKYNKMIWLIAILAITTFMVGCSDTKTSDVEASSSIEEPNEKEVTPAPHQTPQGIDHFSQSATTAGDIGVEKAKEIAFTDVGIDPADATFVKVESDYDDGVLEYEIEFIGNSSRHEYTISANDGEILEKSEKMDVSKSTEPTGDIGAEKAKTIALTDAGIDLSDTTFIKAESDNDDGVLEYEIEFISNSMEFEYSIRANDGSILEKSVEKVN